MYTKPEVNYTHPAPSNNHCGNCVFFELKHKNGCGIVSGVIHAEDVCDKFKKTETELRKFLKILTE